MPPQRRRRMQFAPNRPGFFHPGPAMPRTGIQRNPLPALRVPKRQAAPGRGAFGFGKPNRAASSQGFRFPAAQKRAMSAREKANLAETAARAVRFAGEKLGRPKGLGPSAERMLRIAGPAGQEKHLPRINPMIGAELEEKIEEFYRTVNEGRQRHRFGRDRLQDQFKLMVVTAIAQGQVKSRGEMHEFIRELGKENGWNLDPFKVETQLFTEKQEIEKLNGIFSSYKDLVRRGVIKIQGPRQDEEESAPARRRTA